MNKLSKKINLLINEKEGRYVPISIIGETWYLDEREELENNLKELLEEMESIKWKEDMLTSKDFQKLRRKRVTIEKQILFELGS